MLLRQGDLGWHMRTEAVVDLVAFRVRCGCFWLDQALAQQLLNVRMVKGLRERVPVAQQVGTRVTYVRPAGGTFLNDGGNHRGARRLQ